MEAELPEQLHLLNRVKQRGDDKIANNMPKQTYSGNVM
jgi:hypothetical protein